MEKQTVINNAQVLSDLSQSTIYMMGGSFIVGSMVTLFILLVLDWVRRDASNDK